jgi:hypothetical protein
VFEDYFLGRSDSYRNNTSQSDSPKESFGPLELSAHAPSGLKLEGLYPLQSLKHPAKSLPIFLNTEEQFDIL